MNNKVLINESFDSWIRELFLWTFDHEAMSLWLIAIPIVLWIIIGFVLIIGWGSENESKINNKLTILVFGTYVLTPIIYFFIVGYVGYFIFR